ncbi:MAG: potassium channel family protein [Gammaproteobacteria bacterium]
MQKNLNRLINMFILRYRLLLLLIALLAMLITFPIVHEQYSAYILILELFVTILLIMGIYVISDNRSILTIAILMATLAFTIMWFNIILQSSNLLLFGLLLEIGFFLLTTYTIIRYVLTYKRVTADKIYGSICGYLLIGIIWAFIYTFIENFIPGSFEFNVPIHADYSYLFSHRFYFGQFIYLSFVTISTLGYGDIIPISTPARVFASLEAVAGQLYVAILIARLVGLHISHAAWERRN